MSAPEPLRLSYRDLADRLSLSPSGARALAKRRGWAIARDPSGKSFVTVDPAALGGAAERHAAPGEAMARIAQLVASIKAERGREGAAAAPEESSEQTPDLAALMRRLLAARDREKAEWQQTTERLQGEVNDIAAAAAAARAELAQAVLRHRRAVTDLETLHADQRSIWQLEQRRLELTIGGLEKERHGARARFAWRRLARPARLAVAAVVCVVALGLAKDMKDSALGRRDRAVGAFQDVPRHAAWAVACAGAARCAEMPDPRSGEPTRFLVDGFLSHMAQELHVGMPPAERADP